MKKVMLLLALVLIAGCGGATTPAVSASPSSAHCGLERWAVKVGTDAAASQVDLNAVTPTTIAALTSLPVPAGFSQDAGRLAPVEDTVYQVTATLREYKLEADSDYHLVLADAQGRTMIAEIPAPACVGQGSPFLPGIAKARAAFGARYAPGDFWQPANVNVVVEGVGFFDTIHGQTGVSGNGIELHPVLDIRFGS